MTEALPMAEAARESRPSFGASPAPAPSAAVATIQNLLELPDTQLDYATAKLTLDRIIDPSIDLVSIMAELHEMAATASDLAGPAAPAQVKLSALRKLIYEEGPWNGHRPFQYRHEDPFAREAQLLSSYLETRRGNCVSMPILFLILGDMLGLNLTLATAPDHLLVRYKEEGGQTLNLETTSGALPARDAWLRQAMPMTDQALKNGLYLRSLSRREGIAVIATTALAFLFEERHFQETIAAARIILDHMPTNVTALLTIGGVYGHLVQTEFMDKYPSPFLIPPLQRARYLMLARCNRTAFEAAENLGWVEPEW